ncbi:AI-2E family transporter [Halosegnis longus]|uniref:AI-2E family transporter n=1 Tax=Halosegnis longus TaxID=2216012 RepID=A0AAJ4R8T0_9EURY|nr:AI-2E family transporter [Halosegnis longus]RNJ26261.1 AI-2E family transporter [Salella cibi]
MRLRDVSRGTVAWWALGGFLAVLLASVANRFLGTLAVALFVYYVSRPVYRRLRVRLPASLAAVSSILVLVVPLFLLVGYSLTIGLREFNAVASGTDLSRFESVVRPYTNVTASVSDPAALLDDPDLVATLQNTLATGLDYLGLIGSVLLRLFIIVAIVFYLLRDGPRLGRWLLNRFGDDAGIFEQYTRAVDRDLYRVFSGNILNAVFTAAIGAIVYSVLNVLAIGGPQIPYPALIGLLAGAASLIPVIGMKLVYVPVSGYLVATAASSPDPVFAMPIIFTALSFVVVDTIPDLVLRPYVSGRNLHVGLVMFAYIFGPLVFGWYGIFLGPLVLIFIVHFARVVLPELISGTEIRPFAVDPAVATEPVEEVREESTVESAVERIEDGES